MSTQPRTKVQRFEVVAIDRASIQNAPYNPRQIDSSAKRKLQKNLRAVGLLEPIVVNRRTMNIVAGHQRLAAVDAIEGQQTYSLEVSLVDLDEKREREQNLFFNNPSAQGTWDVDLLARLFRDTAVELSLDETGFEVADLGELFGGESDIARKFDKLAATSKAAPPPEPAPAEPEQAFLVAVFATRAEREAFMRGMDLEDDDKYVDGRRLADRSNVALPPPPPIQA